jgi:hypothetical protein
VGGQNTIRRNSRIFVKRIDQERNEQDWNEVEH